MPRLWLQVSAACCVLAGVDQAASLCLPYTVGLQAGSVYALLRVRGVAAGALCAD